VIRDNAEWPKILIIGGSEVEDIPMKRDRKR
jgi:hypothetical protein